MVSKTTNLELHGTTVKKRVASGRLSKGYLDLLQAAHDDHYQTLSALYKILDEEGIHYQEVGRGLYWPDMRQVKAVITVGGDGTVLAASHHILQPDLLLIGVRSSPSSIGYLCACDLTGFKGMARGLIEGTVPSLSVERLYAEIALAETGGSVKSDPILNDFLYANVQPAATTRYALTVAGVREVQKSSGIWVATPAGSTAAIATAGGEEVSLTRKDFQYVIRELYSPKGRPSAKLRQGFFTPEDHSVGIENLCDQAILAIDGQHGSVQLGFGDFIRFHRAPPLLLAQGAHRKIK